MTKEEIKEIHLIQSRNVRHLKKVQKNMTMDINRYLIKNDTFKVAIKTKLYSLLYSALSEVQFSQIIHTPFGFEHSEILNIQNERTLVDSWYFMLDTAIKKIGDWTTNDDLKQKRETLRLIIYDYIQKPQELRNKIAHGQWLFSLNSKNTKENQDTTKKIKELDVVKISIWFEVHQYLCFIIRDLIQSPQKGFHHNYWINLTNLQEFMDESKSWTLEKKVANLKIKYENRKIEDNNAQQNV